MKSIGIPHAAIEDEVYNGYFIPKGQVLSSSLSCKLTSLVGSTALLNMWYAALFQPGAMLPGACLLIFLKYRVILNNPSAYPDPRTFKPERHILPDGTVKNDPVLACTFGLGRRYG